MGFHDRFIWALRSRDLRDDQTHHNLDPIAAAALADVRVNGFGALLCRVKYADGSLHKEFEGNAANMAQLLRLWTAEVTKRGQARKWVRIGSERDIQTAHILYKRVAEASLAHWLNDKCQTCHGTGISSERTLCKVCEGSGIAPVVCSGGFERERIKDMISELHAMSSSHAAMANRLLRKEI